MAFDIRLGLVLLLAPALAAAAPGERRPLTLDDVMALRDVRDPRCSPDGASVAYVVSTMDLKQDKSVSHVWLARFDGSSEKQLTNGAEGESQPRFSPDGRFLSFTSDRPGEAKGSQVWALELSGGEARQLTNVKGKLQDYEWSPDSKRLALVVSDPDPEQEAGEGEEGGGKKKAPKPIVM